MPSHLLKRRLIWGMLIAAIGIVIAIGATLGSSVMATTTTQLSYTVTELEPLDGDAVNVPKSINNLGQVVGYSISNSSAYHAVLWDKGNKIDLGTLGGSEAYASSINKAGQVVGFSKTSTGANHAVLWDKGNKIDLGTLGGTYSFANSINNAGKVVGYASISNGSQHAVLWNKGKKIDLGTLSNSYTTSAYDINNAGQVVGDSIDYGIFGNPSPQKRYALLWDKRNKIKILPASTEGTIATAINDGGKAVGQSNGNAVVWDKGNKIDLPNLDGTYGFANDINNAGKIVGYERIYYSGDQYTIQALVWDKGSVQDLSRLIPQNSGWRLGMATAINNKGQIVGYGRINDRFHGFLLTPVK